MALDRYHKDKFRFGICDVEQAYQFYFNWLLGKLHEVFVWENLPDSIDEEFLNTSLFIDGMVTFFEKDGKLYALNCGLGGKINEYYEPTELILANPVLGSATFTRDKDCVVMFNTKADKEAITGIRGLYPLIHQTATLLADNIVSINCAQINTRVQALVVADSTAQKNSAELVMKELYSGKPFKVLEDTMIDKIKVNPITANPAANITELVELHQYIIANFYNNIGIKTNYQMKKERLITDEINSLNDFLAVSLDSMLSARTAAVDKINKMFGTNIKVKLKDYLEVFIEDNENAEEVSERKDSDEVVEKDDMPVRTNVSDDSEADEPYKKEENEVATDKEEITTIKEEITTNKEEIKDGDNNE